jgi:putative nucleotidyltransferase with HDIG domain
MNTWEEIQAAKNDEILAWAESEPWARAMAACPQDADWHAEGDVWTHTRLVAAQLEALQEWPQLSRGSQLALLFTALFHDSGKPATTAPDPETGRLRSPKHALRGMEIARSVLRDLGCGLEQREEIAALVRYHGRPAFVLEKEDPAREVISLSWLTNQPLLYLFALADTRGRLSREQSRPEENLHFYQGVAEENNCFGQPYPFANDQARFLFFRDSLSSLYYTPQEDYRCTVTLLSGLPGSGKDRWLAQNREGLPVVSLDDLREEHGIDPTENQGRLAQLAREACREHLRARRDFALNATNTVRQTRGKWIDLCADYGARIEIIYLEPPLQELLAQNSNRPTAVPESIIQRLLDKLEPPTRVEGHALRLMG